MKKLTSLILALILTFVFSIGAFAITTNSVIPTSTLNKILTDYRNALKSGESHVSLSKYGVSGSSAENELYEFFFRADSELGSISYGKYNDCYASPYIESSSGSITGVKINYWDRYKKEDGSCDIELVKKEQKIVNERFVAAKSLAKRSMSDAEKALILYDYVIAITNYPLAESTDINGNETFPDDAYTIVGLFCDGYGVCSSYAKIYAILLNEAGIPAVTVESRTIAHEWVMAKIDGEWYHCDPTWDDYRFDNGKTALWDLNDDSWDKGSVGHYYFLKSDDEFKDEDHPDWKLSYNVNPDYLDEPPVSGKSGAFDDKFFSPKNEKYLCTTMMNYINGSWYFIDHKTMTVVNATYDGEEKIIELPTDYVPKYSFGYGNYLYVSTNSSVLRYDTMSEKFEKIIKLTEEERKTDSFSEMSIINDEMTIVTASYTFDSNNEYTDATFKTTVYPMSEVENMSAIIDDMYDDSTEDSAAAKEPAADPSVNIRRPGSGSEKSSLTAEEKAMLEDAETSGKRMMAFVYLGIAALFIIIATIAIILTIKNLKKK